MSDQNNFNFTGRLAAKPELRYTKKEVPVTNFSVAINRTFRNSADELQDEVCWVKCVLWGSKANAAVKVLDKGSPVAISGRMEQHAFETNEGQRHSYLQCVVENITFLPKGVKKQEPESEPDLDEGYPDDDDPPGV